MEPQTWQDIIVHVFPENIAKSIYNGEVLQVVVFAVIFGVSLAMLPAAQKNKFVSSVELLAEVMFKFTNTIMLFARIGVGAAIAETVGHMGIDVLSNLAMLLVTLYCALIAFILLVLGSVANFGLPEWPVLLIMGIDELMDMARTSVNVIGNCLSTTVIARWEGALDDAKMHASDQVQAEPMVEEMLEH